MLDLVRQPEGSNLCGQACVATLANVSLEEACKAVGKRGRTRWTDVRLGLSKFQIDAQSINPVRTFQALFLLQRSGVFILKTQREKRGHYSILAGDLVFDPALEEPARLGAYLMRMAQSGVTPISCGHIVRIFNDTQGRGTTVLTFPVEGLNSRQRQWQPPSRME